MNLQTKFEFWWLPLVRYGYRVKYKVKEREGSSYRGHKNRALPAIILDTLFTCNFTEIIHKSWKLFFKQTTWLILGKVVWKLFAKLIYWLLREIWVTCWYFVGKLFKKARENTQPKRYRLYKLNPFTMMSNVCPQL